jgi:EAL domain-containing protein (putative c-di-GMP-specific phosphodiesterase class I)
MPDLQILSAEFDSALAKQQIYAVYQPQIDPSTGAVVGVEGLCRWDRADGDRIGPDVFIPLAEASGAIHDVGRFMLDECLLQIDHWRAGQHPVDVAVNVSPLQLVTDRFAEYLMAQLTQHALPGTPLTIEITESLPVGDIDAIVPRLEKLRSAGVGVSLDDYGSGHASLRHLEALPLSEVKLDRSLIQGGTGTTTRILEEAVGRARDLGLRVVAEGVETAEHLQLARSLGCDRVQGYLFAPPMSVGDVDELMAA